MGLIISRNISANNETDTYPAIDPKYGFYGYLISLHWPRQLKLREPDQQNLYMFHLMLLEAFHGTGH